MLPLLPSGTTSNEALHSEINNWFRGIMSLHQCTLALKLQILTLRKQLPHYCAMCSPTTKQVNPGVLLASMVSSPLWNDDEWQGWCGVLYRAESRTDKVELPGVLERQQQVEKFGRWLRQRPAAAVRPEQKLKRTPFNRQRVDNLVRSGVRHSVYKRGSADKPAMKRPASCIVMKKPSAFALKKKPASVV